MKPVFGSSQHYRNATFPSMSSGSTSASGFINLGEAAQAARQALRIAQSLTGRKSRSSVSSSSSIGGPIQYVEFIDPYPLYKSITKKLRRDISDAHTLQDIQPWKKLKKEKGFHIHSVPDSLNLKPPIFFAGFDVFSANLANPSTGDFHGLGQHNPFNTEGVQANRSDIGHMIAHAGLVGTDGQISIDRIQAMLHVINESNAGLEMELYYCRPRKDNSTSLMFSNTSGDHGNSSYPFGAVGINQYFQQAAQGDTLMTVYDNHSNQYASWGTSTLTPYQSTTFCSDIQILAKRKVRLGPGEMLRVAWKSLARGIFNVSNIQDLKSSSDFSRHILIRFRGQLGQTALSEEDPKAVAYLPIDVSCMMHEWIDYRQLPVGDNLFNSTTVSGAQATGAFNVLQPGNVQPPTEQMNTDQVS